MRLMMILEIGTKGSRGAGMSDASPLSGNIAPQTLLHCWKGYSDTKFWHLLQQLLTTWLCLQGHIHMVQIHWPGQ